MEVKWNEFGKEMVNDLNLTRVGQLGESVVSSDGKNRKWYVNIRGSKMVAPACVD
jgi:hypothetical protein